MGQSSWQLATGNWPKSKPGGFNHKGHGRESGEKKSVLRLYLFLRVGSREFIIDGSLRSYRFTKKLQAKY